MMMNLMTVLVKKVFISSKPSIVCLLCPPPCGPFSIQESAVGGLSYKVKKNVPWHILAPRRGCFGNHLPLRRVRFLAERAFYCHEQLPPATENQNPLLPGASFYPSATSSTIISTNPTANPTVPRFECSPSEASGISSSTTT